ncbi:MAG TPA: heavy metal-associated domain-containing protein, partial [Alicycliphilus sp.]|nr:heavy metal-associated domain-containing protein [Alicycliphilus sp.]
RFSWSHAAGRPMVKASPNQVVINKENTMNPTNTRTTLRAEGFSCPSCVTKIEKSVGGMAGVSQVKVHFASARIEVDHHPETVSVDDLIAAIAKVGFTARASAF